MKKILLNLSLIFALVLVPVVSFAQQPDPLPPAPIDNGNGSDPVCASLVPYSRAWYDAGCETLSSGSGDNSSGGGVNINIGGGYGNDTNTQTTPPGSIGSGTLGTNAVNGALDTSGSGFTSTQSGSAELARCNTQFKSLLDILIWLKCIIVVAILPLIFAGAFMFFLWGVLRFMAATDATKKEEGKKFILWGLIGLFVMVSLWGIIKIAGTTLGIDGSVVPILQTTTLKK